MPTIYPPNSDESRHRFLRQANQQIQQDQASGRTQLSAGLVADLMSRFVSFETALLMAYESQSSLSAAQAEKRDWFRELKTAVRSVWDTQKKLVRLDKAPAAQLQEFGFRPDNTRPNLSSQGQWVAMAQRQLRAEARLVAQGGSHVPLANPTAAELQAALDAFVAGETAVNEANIVHKQQRNGVTEQNMTIHHLYRRVNNELKNVYIDLEKPAQRNMMRRYGIVFRGSEDAPESTSINANDPPPLTEAPTTPLFTTS